MTRAVTMVDSERSTDEETSDGQNRQVKTFEVPCGGSTHRITIDSHGPIRLHDHCPELINTEIELAQACGDLDFDHHAPPINACAAIVEAWRLACHGTLAVPSTSWLPRAELNVLNQSGDARSKRRRAQTWTDDLRRRKDALRCYSMARQISEGLNTIGASMQEFPVAVGWTDSSIPTVGAGLRCPPGVGLLLPTTWSPILRVRHVHARGETYVWSTTHVPGDPVLVFLGAPPFLDVRRAPYNPNAKPGPTDFQGCLSDSAPSLARRHWTSLPHYRYVLGERFSSKHYGTDDRRDSDREDKHDETDQGTEALSP